MEEINRVLDQYSSQLPSEKTLEMFHADTVSAEEITKNMQDNVDLLFRNGVNKLESVKDTMITTTENFIKTEKEVDVFQEGLRKMGMVE
jgi:hypothetical protein